MSLREGNPRGTDTNQSSDQIPIQTGTPWDAVWPALARFTNSAADYARSWSGGNLLIGVSHDTDLGPHKRQRFIAAGGVINPPGVKHERGRPVYVWQGETIGKRRAFQIVHQIKHGLIPARPVTPPVVIPPPGNGGSAADQATGKYIDWGTLSHYGPLRRSKRKKKKKSKLRSAAAVLGAAVTRGLQTGDEVLSDLLRGTFRPGGAVDRAVPELTRLLNKVPSEFEQLLYRQPYRAVAAEAAQVALSAATQAAVGAALLLYPSSIGKEPPWEPPTASKYRVRRETRRPRPRPRPYALPLPERGPTMPRPLPHPESPPFAQPRPSLAPRPDPRPSPAPAPYPVAAPAPLPSPTPRAAPTAAPLPSPLASWSSFASPLAAGFAAPFKLPQKRPRVVALPQQFPAPLTQPKPAPLESGCDCTKPTRTKQERKKRCTNPVIKRSRSGDEITITRKITCPASSRKKQ